jgi:hypothetical protein
MYNLVLDKKFTRPLGKVSPGPDKNKISVLGPEPLCSSLNSLSIEVGDKGMVNPLSN